MELISSTLKEQIMNKRKQMDKELQDKLNVIEQKQEEYKKFKLEKIQEINAMILAFNSLFPGTPMAVLPSTSGIDKLIPSEKDESPTEADSVKNTETSKPKWADLVEESVFVPQKPETSHPLQSVHDYCANSSAPKYYVLFNTPLAGIYDSWAKASQVITGVKGAIHKSFTTKEEAVREFSEYKTKNSYASKAAQKPQEGTARLTSLGSFKQMPGTPPASCMPKKPIFDFLLQKILSYKDDPEKCHLEGWYPTVRPASVPKVVILPQADPNIVYEFFIHGLIDSLYFTDLKLFREFPRTIQDTVHSFIQYVLWSDKTKEFHSREGFWKIMATFPIFSNEQVLLPSLMSILMGISSGTYPDNISDGTMSEEIDEYNIRQMTKTYMTIGRIQPEDCYRLNYKNPYMLILSQGKHPLKKMEWKAIQNWEDHF